MLTRLEIANCIGDKMLWFKKKNTGDIYYQRVFSPLKQGILAQPYKGNALFPDIVVNIASFTSRKFRHYCLNLEKQDYCAVQILTEATPQ